MHAYFWNRGNTLYRLYHFHNWHNWFGNGGNGGDGNGNRHGRGEDKWSNDKRASAYHLAKRGRKREKDAIFHHQASHALRKRNACLFRHNGIKRKNERLVTRLERPTGHIKFIDASV